MLCATIIAAVIYLYECLSYRMAREEALREAAAEGYEVYFSR